MFVKVEYKCRLAPVVGRFEVEQGGKREVIWGGSFVFSTNMICYEGMKEGWRTRMRESWSITRHFLHYCNISLSKIITNNPTTTAR